MAEMDAPTYVFTAQHEKEDDDSKMAKLEAVVAKMAKDMEEMKEGKKAKHEEEDESMTGSAGHDGRTIPVVKAMKKAMDEDDLNDAQKAAIMATMEVFHQGNGKNKVGNVQEEPATKVKQATAAQIAKAIRPYEEEIMRPIIANILQANANAGATEEQLKSLEKSLLAKSLADIKNYAQENQALIANALRESETTTAESTFAFNGQTPLIAGAGSMGDIDSILGGGK